MGDFDLENYNDAKSLYKKIKSGQSGQKVLSDLKNLKEKMKSKKIVVGPELEGKIAGYIEFKMLTSGEYVFKEGGLIFKPQTSGLIMRMEGNVEVSLEPSLGIGVGSKKLLCAEASLSGELEAALKIPVSELAKALEISLNAAVEIKAVALGYDIVDYEYIFLDSEDIAVLLKSVSRNKKGEVIKAGIELYDNGQKIPTGEYATELSVQEKVTVTIKAKGINYVDGENPRSITFLADIVNISDSKKVQISKPENQYYSGTQIKPILTVTAGENNLQEGVQYSLDYGKNLNVGSGTVIVNGIPENGYCGTKKVTFKILPKWLKWIFN